MRGISPETLRDGTERMDSKVDKLNSVSSWLVRYNVFTKAKNMGVKFGPTDVNVEELDIFAEIHSFIEKAQDTPRTGKDGR